MTVGIPTNIPAPINSDISQAPALNPRQERILSYITHDLRSPLTAMLGFLALAKKELPAAAASAEAQEYLVLARDAGLRMNQMLNDMLDLFRLEQSCAPIVKAQVPVQSILDAVKRLHSAPAHLKGVYLRFPAGGLTPDVAWCDAQGLIRALDNLLSNAIKFTAPGGFVTVHCKRSAGRLSFEVEDTGRGIPKHALHTIFDTFRQVLPSDGSCGYGLGLAITRHIVEAHGGQMQVISQVGIGSRFNFWIPEFPNPSVSVNPSLAVSNPKIFAN